eukprot:2358762-Prymnesium_polylepis.2
MISAVGVIHNRPMNTLAPRMAVGSRGRAPRANRRAAGAGSIHDKRDLSTTPPANHTIYECSASAYGLRTGTISTGPVDHERHESLQPFYTESH